MRHLWRILRWANRIALLICAGLFGVSLIMDVTAGTMRPNGRGTGVSSSGGALFWTEVGRKSNQIVPIPWRYEVRSLTSAGSPRHRFRYALLGFSLIREFGSATEWGFTLTIPYWAPLLIFLLIEAIPLMRRTRARVLRDLKLDDAPATDGEVAVDLPCVHCGYNLRTRKGSGLCPECGSAVVDTLSLNTELERSRPGWLRCLAIGNGLMLLTRGLLFLVYAFSFQAYGDFDGAGAFALAAAGVYVAVAYLLTRREHPHLPSPDRRMARWLRILAVASLVCLAMGIVHQTHLPRSGSWKLKLIPGYIEWSGGGWWHIPVLILFFLAWLTYSAAVIVEYRFLARLAGRLLDRFMIEHCQIAGTGAAISGVLAVLIVRPIVGHGLPSSDLGWLAMCTTLIAWVLFVIWTGFTNVYCGYRFLKLSWIAQERWRRRHGASPELDAPLSRRDRYNHSTVEGET